MAERDQIVSFLNELLDIRTYPDGMPVGMQVPGAARVRRVATGVSASLELFQRAAQDAADMLIVHHGLFFGSGPRPPLSEQDRDRLKTLFDHDITLAGYHLALDAHRQVGNNAIICDRLGVADREPFGVHGPHTLGFVGARAPPPAPPTPSASSARSTGRSRSRSWSSAWSRRSHPARWCWDAVPTASSESR